MDTGITMFGLQVALIGFSVVIVALVALFFIMIGFSKVLQPNPSKPDQDAASQSAGQASEVSEQGIDDDINSRKVAVIAAAVSQTLGKSMGELQITGIRPIEKDEQNSWKLAGRKAIQNVFRR